MSESSQWEKEETEWRILCHAFSRSPFSVPLSFPNQSCVIGNPIAAGGNGGRKRASLVRSTDNDIDRAGATISANKSISPLLSSLAAIMRR